jgi:site-specific DNA-methyltransferase (adenine-specific)
MAPYYEDGQVTVYCADVCDVDLAEVAAAVVTSPPYNVDLDYDGHGDALPWPKYWRLATDAAKIMHRVLVPGGRAWVNTAVSVPVDQAENNPGKRRVMLAHRWASAL